jgi:hypothetical protein
MDDKHLYGSGLVADQIEILRVFPLIFGQLTNYLKGSAYPDLTCTPGYIGSIRYSVSIFSQR